MAMILMTREIAEFLDWLTGRAPTPPSVPFELDESEDENWRDGTMRDGLRRARRERQ